MVGQLCRRGGTCLVVLRPVSISVVIVFAVPLGPRPWAMNLGTILGKGVPPVRAALVATGSGV